MMSRRGLWAIAARAPPRADHFTVPVVRVRPADNSHGDAGPTTPALALSPATLPAAAVSIQQHVVPVRLQEVIFVDEIAAHVGTDLLVHVGDVQLRVSFSVDGRRFQARDELGVFHAPGELGDHEQGARAENAPIASYVMRDLYRSMPPAPRKTKSTL